MTMFEEVQKWVYRNARPLDLARWQYHFEAGSADAIIKALAAYQNSDGGFGYALECDSWNPNSSPIQTFHAIQILEELETSEKTHPMVQNILKYLNSGADFEGNAWSNTIITNNLYPHAPWWHVESVSTCHDIYNPTIGLVGFCSYFADQGSELFDKCMSIASEAVDYIRNTDQIDMHTLTCFISFLEYCKKADLKGSFSVEELEVKLISLISKSITQDTNLWATHYVCKPSQFFKSRESIYYRENKAAADYECEFISNTRNQEGIWDVTWGWEAYPEEWALSKNWWKSHIVIGNMLYLKNFGKLVY